MKYAVLEEYRITSVQAQIAYLDVLWIDLAFPNEEGLSSEVASARHQRHAGFALMKVRQAVTDLDSDTGQTLMAQVFRNSDIAVPPSSKWCAGRIFRPLVNERRRMEMDVRAKQLNNQRNR